MSEKHSPLPWAVITRQGSWDWVVFQANNPNFEVCQMFHDGSEDNEEGEANAALIVRSVNAMPALVKALEEIASENTQYNWPEGATADEALPHVVVQMRQIARAALATVRGDK